jgi:hypothetical protein
VRSFVRCREQSRKLRHCQPKRRSTCDKSRVTCGGPCEIGRGSIDAIATRLLRDLAWPLGPELIAARLLTVAYDVNQQDVIARTGASSCAPDATPRTTRG